MTPRNIAIICFVCILSMFAAVAVKNSRTKGDTVEDAVVSKTPSLQSHMMPVGGNWNETYDINDLEVVQTYNIAILKAALHEQRVELREVKKTLEQWNIVPKEDGNAIKTN